MTQTAHESTRTDAVIDTGAALASASAFGLFGAVLGQKVGSLGSSGRHNLSGKIGGWLGGVTLSVLSLYASFRSREQHERIISGLRDENERLRAELTGEPIKPLPTAPATPLPNAPKTVIEGAQHLDVMTDTSREQAI